MLVDILSSHKDSQSEEAEGDFYLHLELCFRSLAFVCVNEFKLFLQDDNSICKSRKQRLDLFEQQLLTLGGCYNRFICGNMRCAFEFLIFYAVIFTRWFAGLWTAGVCGYDGTEPKPRPELHSHSLHSIL